MAIDASIYSQFAPAAKSARDFQNDDLERQTRIQGIESNKLALQSQRQKQAEFERATQEQGVLRNALALLPQGATAAQRAAAARGTNTGLGYTQADAWEKADLERQKLEAEARNVGATAAQTTQNTAIKARQDAYNEAAALNTPQDAIAALNRAVSTGKVPMVVATALQRMVETDPQWKLKLLQGALDPEKLKEAIMPQFQNAGGAMVNVNPMAGPIGQGQPNAIPITQSADNKATVGASLANAAAVREAARIQAEAARDSARMRRDQDTEMKLSDDHRAQSKPFQESRAAHEQLTATLKSATTSPAATLAAATKFMKILDPGSVVRESELGMALAASGVLDRAANYISTLQSGKKLTETQAADFAKISDQMYEAAKRVQQDIDRDYQNKAKTYNLRPEMIVQDLGQNQVGGVPSDIDAILKKYPRAAK